MKFRNPTTSDSNSPTDARPMTRAQARAIRRYDRAVKRFARAEVAVETCVRRVHAAEAALLSLLEHPDLTEVQVLDTLVPRELARDIAGMARSDLKIAVRRRADAASEVGHRYVALVANTAVAHTGVAARV